MANFSAAAGDGGVSGPTNPTPATPQLPLATVTGTLEGGNRYATNATANLKGTAIRHSVAQTQGGDSWDGSNDTTCNRSEVYSETLNLRMAYGGGAGIGQDCDTPSIDESSSDTNRTA